LAAELGEGGEQALVLGESLQGEPVRRGGGGKLRLRGRGEEAWNLAGQVGALQLVAELRLAQPRQAARRGVAGAEKSVGGAERIAHIGVVLAGDDRRLALRQPIGQRLAVAGRKIAAGGGELIVHL